MDVVLRYDPAQTARRNSFHVKPVGALWHVDGYVSVTDVATPIHVTFYGQMMANRAHRMRDPENAPVLFITRETEDTFRVEAACLHHSLPTVTVRLIGWCAP